MYTTLPDVMSQADAVGAFIPGPRHMLPPSSPGALDGLTFAVKDLIDVAGLPTGGGNPDWLRAQTPAERSATVIDTLLAAGAAFAGKTITDELAFSLEGVNAHYGIPLNSACPDRLPGGSSSGSAAAVAAGLVDFALGTDTGGSVRVPASFVGAFGFRPSHGAIPLDGVLPFAPSYDTIGWFARDIATLQTVADVLLPKTPATPVRRLVLMRDALNITDPAVAAEIRTCCDKLEVKDEIQLFDGHPNEWRECYRVLQGAEIWHELGGWIKNVKPLFGKTIAPRFIDAASITRADVERWAPVREIFTMRLKSLLSEGVGLVMPTAPCIALRKDATGAEIGEFYSRALALTSVAGHSGSPQISVPGGLVDGCPIGLSILALPGQDRALIEPGSTWSNLMTKKTDA
ncbi:MAG: amidase [Xanthobacteraceae bacterium]|nr:amidase [Xanthobacteraceae bacterium]